jgi:hypothetical protein
VGAAHLKALEILTAERVERLVNEGHGVTEILGVISWDTPFFDQPDGDPVWDRAAPAVLPDLARKGRLAEALSLMDSVPNEDSRAAALKGLLPYWMDADPAAARAAFEAAPLTALERERWERHPAFLLNPPAGGR